MTQSALEQLWPTVQTPPFSRASNATSTTSWTRGTSTAAT